MKDQYYDESGETTFDTRYRGRDVDLFVAGDNTIIAHDREEESDTSTEVDLDDGEN